MNEVQNEQIRTWLVEHAEEKLSSFSSSLIPGAENVLGVRIPILRDYAKKLAAGDWRTYLENAKDDSLEEIMLQGLTLGYVKEKFLIIEPYLRRYVTKIDNWSVCDSPCASLKIAKKEPQVVWDFLQDYLGSDREYDLRFGIVMLLNHYIDEIHINEVLKWMNRIHHDGYYVKMAVAWNLSVCFVRFPGETMTLLKDNDLDDWTYNKSIQKMLESYRVSEADKKVLRSMKRR